MGRFGFSKIVGIPKESYKGEKRVAVSPEGVKKLIKLGYQVKVQKDCGENADFTNEMYE